MSDQPRRKAPSTPATEPSARSAGSAGTLAGAVFLMATSAIGPGFITQTTTFTVQLGAAFAFAIGISLLVDIAIQTNVWRVIGVSGRRAQELGNLALPGVGYLMAILLVVGAFVFNVGNAAGAGLGMSIMTDMDERLGAVILGGCAVAVFLSKRAGVAMDRIVVVLGLLMIGLTFYVAVTSSPPAGSALRNVVLPEQVSALAITTLIGGTIGGYIMYTGIHRLVDAKVTGPENVRTITWSAASGILVTGLMRVIFFLAILGVVSSGVVLDPDAQAASAFQAAAGEVGYRFFGVIFSAAALTSLIGCAYTTITFVTTRSTPARTTNMLVVGFIVLCTFIFVVAGTAPAQLLVFTGAFNGILLPVGVGVLLWVAWMRRDLLNGYEYPRWLVMIGALAWLITIYFAFNAIGPAFDLILEG